MSETDVDMDGDVPMPYRNGKQTRQSYDTFRDLLREFAKTEAQETTDFLLNAGELPIAVSPWVDWRSDNKAGTPFFRPASPAQLEADIVEIFESTAQFRKRWRKRWSKARREGKLDGSNWAHLLKLVKGGMYWMDSLVKDDGIDETKNDEDDDDYDVEDVDDSTPLFFDLCAHSPSAEAFPPPDVARASSDDRSRAFATSNFSNGALPASLEEESASPTWSNADTADPAPTISASVHGEGPQEPRSVDINAYVNPYTALHGNKLQRQNFLHQTLATRSCWGAVYDGFEGPDGWDRLLYHLGVRDILGVPRTWHLISFEAAYEPEDQYEAGLPHVMLMLAYNVDFDQHVTRIAQIGRGELYSIMTFMRERMFMPKFYTGSHPNFPILLFTTNDTSVRIIEAHWDDTTLQLRVTPPINLAASPRLDEDKMMLLRWLTARPMPAEGLGSRQHRVPELVASLR